MFSIRKVKMALVMAAMAAATQSFAGTGQGNVGSMVVGRLGYQVFVQVTNATFAQFACGTPNPNNWTFAFSTQNPGGKDMLATVLAAKASGAALIFVGNGQCTQDSGMEDVSYVIAL